MAENCLKFLSTLRAPCTELSTAKPKDIPNLLPKLLNIIRVIWMNSEHYNTREKLTSLLRKVHAFVYLCVYIQYCSSHTRGNFCVAPHNFLRG